MATDVEDHAPTESVRGSPDGSAPPTDGDLSPTARRLLAAADDLFFRQGAAATTVRAITAACGLTPGALYNHFESKEDLLFRLVMRRHRLIAAAVDEALGAAAGTPSARLEAIVRATARVHLGQRARQGARVANREYRVLTGARLADVVAVRRALRDRVRDVLLDGSSSGAFSLCGDAGRAAATVAASTILDMSIQGAEWIREDGPLSLRELEDQFVAMAMRIAGALQ